MSFKAAIARSGVMNVELALGLAMNAVDEGHVAAALEFYEVALAGSPNNVEVLEGYAETLLHHANQPDRARQMLLHAAVVSPNEGHVKYLNLAQMSNGQEALGFYQRAIDVLRSELAHARTKKERKEISRQISSASCAVAELYLTDLCDDDNAEAYCDGALCEAEKFWDNNIEVHQTRGSLRLSQQRPSEALHSLMEAVRLTHALGEEYQPTYESKIELGRLLMQCSPPDAFKFLLEVLQMDDTNANVWFLCGEAARLRGHYADSARLLKHARMRVPAGDEDALCEIDAAIQQLVVDMGGVEAVNAIPNMDVPNPLDFLEPEPDETGVEGEDGDDDGDNDEPVWGNEES